MVCHWTKDRLREFSGHHRSNRALRVGAGAEPELNEHIDKLAMTLQVTLFLQLVYPALLKRRLPNNSPLVFVWPNDVAIFDDLAMPLFKEVIDGEIGTEKMADSIVPACIFTFSKPLHLFRKIFVLFILFHGRALLASVHRETL